MSLMVAPNLASWEQMKDASGRVYLADRATGTSKWLWTKWDLNGQVFCENVLTKERKWPSDMDIALKVAAGMANPAELKAFLTPSDPYAALAAPQQAPNMQYGYGYGQGHGRANQQMHSHNPLRQHAPSGNNHQARSYAAATVGNASFGGYPMQQQNQNHHQYTQFGRVPSGTSRQTPSGFRSTPLLANNSSSTTRFHSGNRNRTGHQADKSWRNHDSQAYPPASQYPTRRNAVGVTHSQWTQPSSKDAQNSHLSSSSAPRRNVSNGVHTGSRTVLSTTKRSAQNDTQYGNGRYWQPLKNQPMNRRARLAASKTNNSVFRVKPMPVTSTSFSIRKTSPTSMAARKLLKQFASHAASSRQVAAMHIRDFSVEQDAAKVSNNQGEDTKFDDKCAVVGTCQDVEKEFLRLTSAPRPEFVRPPQVLTLSLDNVRKRWNSERDYDWACRQMKAIRQDYKVQHIESVDSLETYEFHARLALENGDLGEFNTCVAQAQDLHSKIDCPETRKDEFSTYRILYNTVVAESPYEQARLIAKLTPQQRLRPFTSFALSIRQAFLANNYHRFFVLCAEQPRDILVAYLIQRLIPAARSKALAAMVVAYAPAKPSTISLTFIMTELGFRGAAREIEKQVTRLKSEFTDEELGQLKQVSSMDASISDRDAILFLISINAVLVCCDGDLVIDCKASKQKGITILDHQRGLITHAGGQ